MKVLLLSEAEYKLALAKVEHELHCAQLNLQLMRAWEREHKLQWHSHKWLRKRSIEAHRLKRILSQ